MTTLRATAANVLDGLGAFRTLLKVRQIGLNSWVTVLTYHRVAAQTVLGDLDRGVVDAREDTFDAHLRYLKKHCTVIDLEALRGFLRGHALPPNPVLVTFDDGYRDNHDLVLPILKRHGVRAVFFIATDYVTQRRLFWWDRASVLVRRCKKDTLDLTYPSRRQIRLGSDDASRARALRTLLVPIKQHYGIDIRRYLDELESATEVSLSRDEERKLADEHILTWDQIKAMRDAGMAIQSHTQSHRILGTLDERALDEELGGAREELESRLGHHVCAVAYPVGHGLACAPIARRAVRRAGYELGFSNGTGLNTTLRFDPLDVRRLALDLDLPDAYFRGMVALPGFAYEPRRARSDHAY